MEIDPLRDLLLQADDASPPPAVAAGLTARVLLANRRKNLRRAAVVMLLGLAAGGVAISTILRKGPLTIASSSLSPKQVAEIRAELASLDADADRHHRSAEEYRLHPPRAVQQIDVAQFAPNDDVLQRVDEQRERAALTLLRWADHTAGEPVNHAKEIYSQVARLFPDTSAGRIAAGHLKSVQFPT